MKLNKSFFSRDCLQVAPALVGKLLILQTHDGERRLRITETEAYRGEEDTACHAHRGKTKRTEVLYMSAGTIYVYLCYGIHWLLNIVTGTVGSPQAVLIRACDGADGPGKLTKALGITGKLNRADITDCELSIVDDGARPVITTRPRVGINYASREDREKPWRFIMEK
jgi:DNA-3-methyladenine glycosylase